MTVGPSRRFGDQLSEYPIKMIKLQPRNECLPRLQPIGLRTQSFLEFADTVFSHLAASQLIPT